MPYTSQLPLSAPELLQGLGVWSRTHKYIQEVRMSWSSQATLASAGWELACQCIPLYCLYRHICNAFPKLLKSPLRRQHQLSIQWSTQLDISLLNPPSFTPAVLLVFSQSVVSDSLQPHGLQHARLPCPSLSPGVCSNSWSLSRWCHPTTSSFVSPFSSCPQSFPA